MSDGRSARKERPLLFEPLTLRQVTTHNRIMISPMCQYSAPDAVPNDWHLVHLASRAVGGAGIVMTEATAVEPAGRITPYDVGLWSDTQERAWARIASLIEQFGAVPGMQLAHAGRKASHRRPWEDREPLSPEDGGWEVIGPSAIPWAEDDLVPREMTEGDVERVIRAFADAARRAREAGFRILEIHAAHGYLLHSFLSPLSNRRTDRFGGDLEARARLLLEVVGAVRAVWPQELPLLVRLSATDWVPGGVDLTETVAVAQMLKPLGVDLIDCSSGGSSPEQRIAPVAGYQVEFAREIRARAKIRTGAVGLLSEPSMAEELLAASHADLVVLGRIALWDPYWPHHAADQLGLEPSLPIQYQRAVIHSEQRRAARADRRSG